MPAVPRTISNTTVRRAIQLSAILLILDILLIGADLLRHYGVLHDARFAVTTERGFGEWFQYAKSAAVVLLLLAAAGKTRAAVAWAGLVSYLLLDDAFEVHERAGAVVASVLSLPSIGPIHASQLGELTIYAVVGLAFVVALGAILRGGDPLAWWLSVRLAAPFALLVFFGAGVDLFHSALANRSYRYVAGVIEDGGEMIAMTLLLAVTYCVTHLTGSPRPRSMPPRRHPNGRPS